MIICSATLCRLSDSVESAVRRCQPVTRDLAQHSHGRHRKCRGTSPEPRTHSTHLTTSAKQKKAARLELASDLDGAFKLYIQAAQSYLHMSRTTPAGPVRDKAKASASKCLERAERIKAVKRDKLTPVRKDRFSSGTPFLGLLCGLDSPLLPFFRISRASFGHLLSDTRPTIFTVVAVQSRRGRSI